MPEWSVDVWLGCFRGIFLTWLISTLLDLKQKLEPFFFFSTWEKCPEECHSFIFFFHLMQWWCRFVVNAWQGLAGKSNSIQAGALACCCPFCIIVSIFLGMVLSPVVSTLVDDVRALCEASLAQACSHQSVWKSPVSVWEITKMDISWSRAPVL